MKKPVMLMILDGFGCTDHTEGNAVRAARTPNFDYFWDHYPHAYLKTSGLAVGLPEGQMGNSEVGHMNIGAGRIIYQELTKITKMIESGEFFTNTNIIYGFERAMKNDGDIHLLGLLSDGGVHSHIDHVKALLEAASRRKAGNVYLHAFFDGRDTSPTKGIEYLKEIEETMTETGTGKVASVSGRYYAMDRDKRWERIEKAYDAMVYGKGNITENTSEYLENSYKDGITDEFIVPASVYENGKPRATIKNGDTVIFFNFRPDRAREITRALNDTVFDGFKREKIDLTYVTFTQYDETLQNVLIAYPPEQLTHMVGEMVSLAGKKQLRIAETEKYAHVTFFFNGGEEAPYEGEDRILVPSPKVATYDLQPEMSAPEVTDAVINAMDKEDYDLIVLNYANCDMVGHTGKMDAAVKAVEYIDGAMKRVIDKVISKGGSVFVTADHGNAEQLVDYKTGQPFTSHTTNQVPLIYITEDPKKTVHDGILSDLAPTMLEEMGMVKPAEMTSNSLFTAAHPDKEQ